MGPETTRLLSLILSLISVTFCIKENPTLCVETGACYKGSWIMTERGNRFAAFRGVKYAEDPVGELRFKAPKPFDADNAIWDVSGNSKIACLQEDLSSNLDPNGGLFGQEDCLVLNIYVPESAITNQEALPVMAWIHGGGLVYGVNYYDDSGPQMYMDRDVVLVTVNYRLSILGFFSLGDEIVPGNAGLKDQSLALKWINTNINGFYGNPDMITIFGESAGGQSVGYHIISPMSRGLFRRAIMQSGTPLDSWATPLKTEFNKIHRDQVLEFLGCPIESALECMQGKEAVELLRSIPLINSAVIDSDFTSEPFLPADAKELYSNGNFDTNLEILIGTNSDEGIMVVLDQLADPNKWQDLKNLTVLTWYLFGNEVIYEDMITDEFLNKADKLIEFYVGTLDNFNEDHKQEVFDMFTDSAFLYGSYKTVKYLLDSNVPVYQYILTFVGQYSQTDSLDIEKQGVCHGDDLIYIFNPSLGFYGNFTMTEPDSINLREEITSAWTNFAKYGDPTPPDSDGNWRSWTPLDKSSPLSFWNISGDDSAMEDDTKIVARMEFWENLSAASASKIHFCLMLFLFVWFSTL